MAEYTRNIIAMCDEMDFFSEDIENEKKKHYGARSYIAEHKDLESCLMKLNSYLSQSGFHELYVGNSFDCIIYCSMESDMPLSAFREYMCIVKDWSK